MIELDRVFIVYRLRPRKCIMYGCPAQTAYHGWKNAAAFFQAIDPENITDEQARAFKDKYHAEGYRAKQVSIMALDA